VVITLCVDVKEKLKRGIRGCRKKFERFWDCGRTDANILKYQSLVALKSRDKMLISDASHLWATWSFFRIKGSSTFLLHYSGDTRWPHKAEHNTRHHQGGRNYCPQLPHLNTCLASSIAHEDSDFSTRIAACAERLLLCIIGLACIDVHVVRVCLALAEADLSGPHVQLHPPKFHSITRITMIFMVHRLFWS
jgi:hypothetical protein